MLRSVVIAVTVAATPIALTAQKPLTDSRQIVAALERGAAVRNGGLILRDEAIVTSPTTGFLVWTWSPTEWLVQQASAAAKEHRVLTIEDVPDEWTERVLRVEVQPSFPTHVRSAALGRSVQHVVLRSIDRAATVQPLSKDLFDMEMRNEGGAVLTFTGARVQFALDDVHKLRARDKKGEFFITVVAAKGYGDKDFRVKEKHFRYLQ